MRTRRRLGDDAIPVADDLLVATDVRTGVTTEHECDVVVCATGLANAGRPHVPELRGRTTSRVEVLHSSELTTEIFDTIVGDRRKVVVLGAGKSPHEILWLLRALYADTRALTIGGGATEALIEALSRIVLPPNLRG